MRPVFLCPFMGQTAHLQCFISLFPLTFPTLLAARTPICGYYQ